MKKMIAIAISLLALFCSRGVAQTIRYVAPTPSGFGNGSSWASASDNLQAIINAAGPNTQIWVKQGVYKPTAGTDRTISFAMKNGVAIYGGFAGNETQLSQRNWQTNITRLTGEIGAAATTDNSYHVISNNGLDNTAILDGFVIQRGNANGNANQTLGGGILNLASSPQITNCIFAGNNATSGGGMNNGNGSNPVITNCSFGALINGITVIPGNSASSGGAIANNASNPSIINCSIANNTASGSGGGIDNIGSNSIVTNSIIWGNTGGQITNASSTPVVTFSIVQGGFAGTGNLNLNPLFVDAVNGNLHLQAGSPATNTGLNSANNKPLDLDGNPRMVNGTIDRGAYETPAVCPPSGILYVDADAAPGGNGSTWQLAFTKLQDALANTCAGITQIWVAAGTYYPDEGGGKADNDRSASFVMKNNLAIYGGFAGTETQLSQRNRKTNITILSGDIGTANNAADNSYHVVFNNNNGLNATAILDGFTITRGNANNETGNNQNGGGILNITSAPAISNCQFINNSAVFGGGLYNLSTAPATITNCSFAGNTASIYGGGMLNNVSNASIINCSFGGNTSNTVGAGGGIMNIQSNASITNCIIWGNTNGDLININGSTPTVTYSIVQGGFAGTGNLNANPLFVNATNGNLHLFSCSPAVNTATATGAPATDLEGNARPALGGYDMGAYEVQSNPQTVIYVHAAATGANNGSSWTDAFTKLQDALANTCTGITQIWVAAGTYYPDEGGGKTDNDRSASFVMKNNLAIYGGFAGGETQLSQRNWKTNPTTFSGDINKNDAAALTGNALLTDPSRADNSYHVVFNSTLNATAELNGFIIKNGNANGTDVHLSGGGMSNQASSPTITYCNFTDNGAIVGGGITNEGGSNPVITYTSFSNNSAVNGGGGMYNHQSLPVVSNCSFTANAATGDFGVGGGIYNNLCSPNITNCAFANNKAISLGGGITNGFSAATITNCSFAGNDAPKGGAILNTSTSPVTPVIINCIAWGNTGIQIENINVSTPSVSYSIVQGGYAGTTNLNIDPLFVNAANADLHLQIGSPAINTGLNSANPQNTDLDGNPRLANGTIDRGAYEIPPICSGNGIVYVNVNATGANNGSSWADAYLTLQDALANSCAGTTQLWVAKGTYYPDEGGGKVDNDRNASFVMKNNLAIYGGFAGGETQLSQRNWKTNPTTLSGDIGTPGNVADNSYHVVFNLSNGLNATAILDGFTITGGNGSPQGGGMTNIESSPAITNCSFTGNSASFGGGMYNASSSPSISNCSFAGNSGFSGGGAMVNSQSNPSITNCSFRGNSSPSGGGMYNYSSSPSITNCSFAGNSASSIGGGMFNENISSPLITNCIFWGNQGVQVGNNVSTPTITYSIVQGGYAGTGNLDADPLFVNAAGGDLRLQTCSPAQDAGNDAATATTTDLDGNLRKFNGKAGASDIDMGAYESQSVCCPPTQVVYVKANATGANNGSSWANAFNSLQDALGQTALCASITQIWVAAGTYKPTNGTSKEASFEMKGGVSVYGGFAGTETQLEQRNWNTNTSVLSGDIGTENLITDNSYHVVSIKNLSNTVFLDGFTISYGNGVNGNSAVNSPYGGGIYSSHSYCVIKNCRFTQNKALVGAAAYVDIWSSLEFRACIFSQNSASDGGAVSVFAATASFVNCLFTDNTAQNTGGAISVISNAPQAELRIFNCTFGPHSQSGGFVINTDQNTSATIYNTIIWGNNASLSPAKFVSKSIVQGGYAGTGNLNIDPLFVNAANGNLRLQACSPAINMGSDEANSSTVDLDGNPRKVGTIDMGAYEQQSGPRKVLYLAQAAVGNGDGSSWANAFTSLPQALFQLRECYTSDTLKIAAGTYSGDGGQIPLEIDKLNAVILGGYPANGGNNRDPVFNPVIIQGNITVRKSLRIDGVKLQIPN